MVLPVVLQIAERGTSDADRNNGSHATELCLSVMVNALKDQLTDQQFQSMGYKDRISSLVDAVYKSTQQLYLHGGVALPCWK